jgi:hypothetical protein
VQWFIRALSGYLVISLTLVAGNLVAGVHAMAEWNACMLLIFPGLAWWGVNRYFWMRREMRRIEQDQQEEQQQRVPGRR